MGDNRYQLGWRIVDTEEGLTMMSRPREDSGWPAELEMDTTTGAIYANNIAATINTNYHFDGRYAAANFQDTTGGKCSYH